MNNMKLDSRTIIIGVVVLIAAIFILPRLFNTADTNINEPVNNPVNTPVSNSPSGQAANDGIQLGRVVSAVGVDRDGCATSTATSFDTDDDIFVVAEDSDIPAGTQVFVRLYRDGQPVEDAPEITADQNYTNSCVNFVFEPLEDFEAGNYEAEFVINGNAADTIQFQVR